jgi:hypothetical protein
MDAWVNDGSATRGQRCQLRELEGRRVSVGLRDGSRIDDCQLISIGRNGVGKLWLFTEGSDVFVAIDEVIEVWEAVSARSRAA